MFILHFLSSRKKFYEKNLSLAKRSSLKTHDSNFSNRPPCVDAEHFACNYHEMVFAPYGSCWCMLCKLCNTHLFSTKALQHFHHVCRNEVVLLVERVGKGEVVNLGQGLNIYATNALGREVVGRRVFVVGEEAKQFKDMIVEMMKLAEVFNIGDFMLQLKWLDLQEGPLEDGYEEHEDH